MKKYMFSLLSNITKARIVNGAKSPSLIGFGVAFVTSILIAAPAQAWHLYECELSANSEYGWIPSELWLSYDEKAGKGQVHDGYVDMIYGKPIPAEFSRRDSKSIVLKWMVKGIPASNRRQKYTVSYSAILRPGTGKISMTAYLRGADGSPPRGSGTCKRVK